MPKPTKTPSHPDLNDALAASSTGGKQTAGKAPASATEAPTQAGGKAARKAAGQATRAEAAEPARSCYLLRLLHTAPFDYDERHVFPELDAIRPCLERLMGGAQSNLQAGALLFESECTLLAIDQGKVVAAIEVKDFLSARLGKRPACTLSELLDSGEEEEFIEQAEQARDSEAFWRKNAHFQLDWPALSGKMPPLTPPLLAPGEEVTVADQPPRTPRGLGPLLLRYGSLETTTGQWLVSPPPAVDQ